METLLDDMLFTCSDCNKEFSHIDGTWPHGSEGKWIVSTTVSHMEDSHGPDSFICYECLAKRDYELWDDEESNE